MLVQLGDFQFDISTLAYDSLSRTATARIARHEIAGGGEKLHAMGTQADSIRLAGTFYPQLAAAVGGAVGTESIDEMRETLKAQDPLLLTAGDGNSLGFWMIESIENEDALFAGGDGVPRRQRFNIKLVFFGERLLAAAV